MRWITSLLVCLFATIAPRLVRSQVAQLDQSANGVGVSHYEHPESPHYRLLFGMGGNAGLATETPVTTLGEATYQMGSDLFSAAFVSNSSTGGYPPKNFSEFDLLYGYSFGEEVARYERPPQFFHLALSAGIGLDTYSERWRHFRRGFVDTSNFSLQPNTFDYAVGFPVQMQAVYEPFRYFGIGALLYVSFNRLSPNYGGVATIEVRY